MQVVNIDAVLDTLNAINDRLAAGDRFRCDWCGSRTRPSAMRFYVSKRPEHGNRTVLYMLCRDCSERLQLTNSRDHILDGLEDRLEAALEMASSEGA